MIRFTLPILMSVLLISVLVMISCGGESNDPITPEEPKTVSSVGVKLGPANIENNLLTVPVEYFGASGVQAMSMRVSFDSGSLKPIRVDWADFITDDDAVFQLFDQDGFVPLALGKMDGGLGLSGNGELCKIVFEITGEYQPPVILNESDFLLAYNALGDRIKMIAGGDQ